MEVISNIWQNLVYTSFVLQNHVETNCMLGNWVTVGKHNHHLSQKALRSFLMSPDCPDRRCLHLNVTEVHLVELYLVAKPFV